MSSFAAVSSILPSSRHVDTPSGLLSTPVFVVPVVNPNKSVEHDTTLAPPRHDVWVELSTNVSRLTFDDGAAEYSERAAERAVERATAAATERLMKEERRAPGRGEDGRHRQRRAPHTEGDGPRRAPAEGGGRAARRGGGRAAVREPAVVRPVIV